MTSTFRCFKESNVRTENQWEERVRWSSVTYSTTGKSKVLPHLIFFLQVQSLKIPRKINCWCCFEFDPLPQPSLTEYLKSILNLGRQRTLANYEYEYVCRYIYRHVLQVPTIVCRKDPKNWLTASYLDIKTFVFASTYVAFQSSSSIELSSSVR